MPIKKLVIRFWEQWVAFWFAPIDLINAAVFRMVFGFTLLLMYGVRAMDLSLFYSSQGFLPADKASQAYLPFIEPSFFLFPKSDVAISLLYVLFLLLIVLFIVGLLPRLLVFLMLLIHLAFLQRNSSILYGADIMVNHFLFYFCLVPSHRCLSAWNIVVQRLSKKELSKKGLSRKWKSFEENLPDLSRIGIRLVQIQLCAIYFYAGLEKIRGESWWDGSAIWRVLGDRLLVSAELSFLQNWSPVIAVATYCTLIFEIFFVAAVMSPRWRYPWLVIGCVLHFGIAAIMNLPFFSMIMTSTYILFLYPQDLKIWLGRYVPGFSAARV